MGLLDRARALLGVSAYQPPPRGALTLDSHEVESARESFGGQIQPIPYTQTRWYLADLEYAQRQADTGLLTMPARLMRSARADGTLAGILSTRTGGLVRLPKKFRGLDQIVAALQLGGENVRSVFDEMCPPAELALLAADGILLGVGVGELLPVPGRDYPVLCRLDPEFLQYNWTEGRWYYRSIVGSLPITPGDGRWVLHVPGGRIAPWQHGLWKAIGRAYIRKEHAQLHKDAWEAKLAHPARVAVSPQGAGEAQKQAWFRQVMQWGVNSVFGVTPGYDVKLLESNGRGFESFDKTIAEQNAEMIIAIAGQTVTVDGGAGFSNADVHKSIRADLIKDTADGLAYTCNTQILPAWIESEWGIDALEAGGAVVEWDVTPPADQTAEASVLGQVATAMTTLREALSAAGRELDVDALSTRFGIPLRREASPSAARSPLAVVRDAA